MSTTQLNGQPVSSPSLVQPSGVVEPSWFINRELSWLDFNERVLEEARDPSNPLLERLRFLAICASNLDEFFEVRVAGLQAQLYENLEPQDPPPDGMGPLAQLIEIARRAHDFVARLYEVWLTEIRPLLAKHGIRLCEPHELTDAQTTFLDEFFDTQVYPVLTPLAIDPAHPFPHVHNKSLNLLLRIESNKPHARPLYAVLQVPSVLNRLVPLPDESDGQRRFVLLEDVIGPRLDALFGGYRTTERVAFRVTRNSDLTIQENEVRSSLLSTIEETLRQRKWGAAVRLEISERADEDFLAQLLSASALELEDRDVYKVPGPVDLTALLALCKLEGFRDLKEPPFEPQMPAALAKRKSIFSAIRDQDILVHHPYESFGSVVQFIEQASEDPQVLAIKMTLYRTAEANPIITALARAAENGKQVTALVELQARLDEENNIDKARMLQKAGVHVVYGIVGLKTHCKASLVVRRDHDGIRRYVHLATGNYNPTTARLYTDLSFFTCRREFGEDASALFNLLTGYSRNDDWNKLIVAPSHFADRVAALIDREMRARRGGTSRADHRQDEFARRSPDHRHALPGLAGRRADRPDHPRHLLPAPRHAGRLGQNPGHQHRRQIPRTLADHLFSERRRARGLPRVGRLDAAQLPPPRRDHVPDRRSAAQAAAGRRHPGRRLGRQRQGPRASARRNLPPRTAAQARRAEHSLPAGIPEHGRRAERIHPDRATGRDGRELASSYVPWERNAKAGENLDECAARTRPPLGVHPAYPHRG